MMKKFKRQAPPPNFTWDYSSVNDLRMHLGVSQTKLAEDMGIRQQTISEWETGMYEPHGSNITVLTLIAVSSGFQFFHE